MNMERHLLVNPLDEDPELLFAYDLVGDGVSIIARDDNSKERVDACIKYLGLNREKLLDRRRVMRRILCIYYAFYEDPAIPDPHKRRILREMRKMTADGTELAGIVRYYLRNWGVSF